MKVIECNLCGDVLAGAGDDELVADALRHYADRHADVEFDEARARDMVQRNAYEASDS